MFFAIHASFLLLLSRCCFICTSCRLSKFCIYVFIYLFIYICTSFVDETTTTTSLRVASSFFHQPRRLPRTVVLRSHDATLKTEEVGNLGMVVGKLGMVVGACDIPKKGVFEWETWRFHELELTSLWPTLIWDGNLSQKWRAQPSSFVLSLKFPKMVV